MDSEFGLKHEGKINEANANRMKIIRTETDGWKRFYYCSVLYCVDGVSNKNKKNSRGFLKIKSLMRKMIKLFYFFHFPIPNFFILSLRVDLARPR